MIKDWRMVVAPRKGFLGIGNKLASYEVTVKLPAEVSVTWKKSARIAVEIGEKPKPQFDPFLGSGVCDVCNGPLMPGFAYIR